MQSCWNRQWNNLVVRNHQNKIFKIQSCKVAGRSLGSLVPSSSQNCCKLPFRKTKAKQNHRRSQERGSKGNYCKLQGLALAWATISTTEPPVTLLITMWQSECLSSQTSSPFQLSAWAKHALGNVFRNFKSATLFLFFFPPTSLTSVTFGLIWIT